jgi:alkylation response protein AidB-like acyl-CoA dehydrogenase
MTGVANFNEVFFTDVRVPTGQIVGQRGEGWKVANTILGHERGSLGDPNATMTRFNALLELMRRETVDGQRLIDNPLFRDRLAALQSRVLAMRLHDMRLLSNKVNDESAPLASLITKLQGTELRHELEGFAIDVLGELGLAYGNNPDKQDGGSWQTSYMYFLGLIIGGGTSQIQKNIISERGLGMPREPKLAK